MKSGGPQAPVPPVSAPPPPPVLAPPLKATEPPSNLLQPAIISQCLDKGMTDQLSETISRMVDDKLDSYKMEERPNKEESVVSVKDPQEKKDVASPQTGQGEDSGIESMDALSEKSPNQGESPCRKEGTEVVKAQRNEKDRDISGEIQTPSEPQPIRITPPLYTYSNPEKHRDTPSPPTLDHHEPAQRKRRRKPTDLDTCPESLVCLDVTSDALQATFLEDKKSSKSLLEQLLIEIPDERRLSTRNTRSKSTLHSPDPGAGQKSTPRSSPLGVTRGAAANLAQTPASTKKRKRNESGSSSNADEFNPSGRQTGKRKCSENAAELIKACMGLEEGQVNNSAAIAVGNPTGHNNKSQSGKATGISGNQQQAIAAGTQQEREQNPRRNKNRRGTTSRSLKGPSFLFHKVDFLSCSEQLE